MKTDCNLDPVTRSGQLFEQTKTCTVRLDFLKVLEFLFLVATSSLARSLLNLDEARFAGVFFAWGKQV